jgi:integrase/recombinase XerD
MATTEASPSTSSSSRPRRRPPEVLTEPEAVALIRACSPRAPTGIRNRALIATLWRSGLRISEALALELRDVDLQAGTLRVRHGNGDKSRTVGVDEQTAALSPVGSTVAVASRPAPGAPVFCTLQGDRVDPSYVRHLLPRLARKANISRRVAAELARARTPSNVIRDARALHARRYRPLRAPRRPHARDRHHAGAQLATGNRPPLR